MSYKILLVDDEPLVTESIARTLHKDDYQVLSVNSAQEALDVLEHEKFDIVISDEMMPGMLGTDLLRLVCDRHPETMRIMLTGHPDLETALRAVNLGYIYRFLIKPCNAPELRMTIRQAIQHRELARKSLSLLKTVKQQNAVLENLENRYPGITHVTRDVQGAIDIGETQYDLDSLIEEINLEVEKSALSTRFVEKTRTEQGD